MPARIWARARPSFWKLTAAADTVWQRRLQLDSVPVAGSVLDDQINAEIGYLEVLRETRPGVLGRRSPRDIVEEALYVPDYLPVVRRRLFLTSFSGQVWLESHERIDAMRVWYSVVRGDTETPPRRVLLPESFRPRDATETHVWGVWSDELGVNHVEGRRLVELGDTKR